MRLRRTQTLLLLAGLSLAPIAPASAADSPASAAAPAWSTADSTIGDLLDNPATKAVLLKIVPQVVNGPQIDMARSMTLQAIQPYAPDDLSDAVLAKIDAALAKIPAPPSAAQPGPAQASK